MFNIIDASDSGFRPAAIGGEFKGACKNLSNSDYHGLHKYWSSTALKFLHKHSPFHFREKFFGTTKDQYFEPSPQMVMGSLAHCLILTPDEFENDFFILPDLNYRTNEGKARREEFYAANHGKTPITQAQLVKANAMRSSCMANEDARKLLEPALKEIGLFWQCPFSQLNFKAKVDALGTGYFVELKTTSDASPEGFARHAYNMNYDLSLFHYRDGIGRALSHLNVASYFIVVEQEPPYCTQVYKVGQGFYETGHDKWLTAVTKLERGAKFEEWPGYFPDGMGTPELQPPSWALNRLSKIDNQDDDVKEEGLF